MIEQKVENAIQQDLSIAGCLKQIEKVGRVCYGSENKIDDDSYKTFTEMLRKNKHYSPFGHGTLVIDIPMLADYSSYNDFTNLREFVKHFELRYRKQDNGFLIISARVLAEASDYYNIDYFSIVSPCTMDFKETHNMVYEDNQRITIKCITSIAMTRELNRHGWALDICERSTRYTKAFDYIKPYNWDNISQEQKALYENSTITAFNSYNQLLKSTPKQIARDILPLNTLTEVYYTAFRDQWQDVIDKRTAKGVHPQMIDLMNKINKELCI